MIFNPYSRWMRHINISTMVDPTMHIETLFSERQKSTITPQDVERDWRAHIALKKERADRAKMINREKTKTQPHTKS